MIRARNTLRCLPAAPWRVLAGALVGLVLGLSFAGVSPEAHAWAHGDDPHAACAHETVPVAPAGHEDHVCAVELFSKGIDLPVACTVAPVTADWRAAVSCAREALFLPQPKYLWHPERGPPAA